MAAAKDIRNICLLGHGGSGKTSLSEALLFYTKSTDRLGKVTEGNTVSDYDPEETRRMYSMQASVLPFAWKGAKINIIDTPGFLDFVSEALQGVRVADSALIVVNAKAGVEVGTEFAFEYASEGDIPKAVFVNRCDEENINFEKAFEELRGLYGAKICPVFVPVIEEHKCSGYVNLINMKFLTFDKSGEAKEGAVPAGFAAKAEEYRQLLCESVAETDNALMDKFFAEEKFTEEELMGGLRAGMKDKSIIPVLSGSSVTLAGIGFAADVIASCFPNPLDRGSEFAEGGAPVKIEEGGSPAIFIYKTVADPFVGKMSYFKVMNGTVKRDMTLKNPESGQSEKLAHIYTIKGKKQTEVDELCCGDLGMTAKLTSAATNDTLALGECAPYRKIAFPEPFLKNAILPKAKGDEDKISVGIQKLLEEDLSIKYENNGETRQMLISGLGEIHIDVIVSKLKNRFGTSVEMATPRVAYRETIKKEVDVEGKHKKQSGGHGQYGHVKIKFKPGEEPGLTFTETVFGGSVPKNYHPAVEKGLQECMRKGVLAGFPVVHLHANLYDGSYHDVDSSEMSFKLAASLAFKELKNANPVILEPIGELKVFVPDALVGDIIGDLNKRRGRVMGMNPSEAKKGYTIVEAEVPEAEMQSYTVQLRAVTQGRGRYEFRFARYEEAPGNVAAKVIEEAKKLAAEEE